MAAARRWRVRGRVQGVSFRAATRARAISLGLAGEARNLSDGSVLVTAFGPEAALDALADWLWQGPPAARVAVVEPESGSEPLAIDGSGFTIA